ncbi:MAG: CsgG/HfaB family protein [candidate division Zixibacteria bacterium]|nr:CsgG/HfaB family protein [candidate division Zixibacteria bacterium]
MKQLFIYLVVGAVMLPVPVTAQVDLYLKKQLPVKTERLTAIAIGEDNLLIAAGTKEGTLFIYDAESDDPVHELKFHRKAINEIIFSAGDEYLVASADDKRISVWELGSGTLLKTLDEFNGKIKVLCLSPDSRLLAAGGSKKEILLWEFPGGFHKGTLKGHDDEVIYVVFGTDKNELLSVGKDRRLIWWDLKQMKAIRQVEIDVQTMPNSGIDILSAGSDDSRLFIAVGLDEQVLKKGGQGMIFKYNMAFYDWNDGSLVKVLEDNNRSIRAFDITPGNCYIVLDNSTLQQNILTFRDITSGHTAYEYKLQEKILTFAVAPKADMLVAALADSDNSDTGRLNLWELNLEVPSQGCFMSKFAITSPQTPLLDSGGPFVLAVMPFSCSGLEGEMGLSVPRFLESKLVNSPYVQLVERSRIDEIIKELEFQESRYIEKQAARIGKILGARYLISGSIDKLGRDIIIAAKLVDTETSEITGIREIKCQGCNVEDAFKAVYLLAPTLARIPGE